MEEEFLPHLQGYHRDGIPFLLNFQKSFHTGGFVNTC